MYVFYTYLLIFSLKVASYIRTSIELSHASLNEVVIFSKTNFESNHNYLN